MYIQNKAKVVKLQLSFLAASHFTDFWQPYLTLTKPNLTN